MSVYLYDEALTSKILSWTEGLDVHVYSPSDTKSLFSILADENGDQPIKLPIICISRKPSYTIEIPNKEPLSYDGLSISSTFDRTILLNAIPVKLQYLIDVYTRYLKDADEYTRNLIFNLINFPIVRLTLPYNDQNITHDSVIELSSDIQDNSDIPERLIKGQFTRFSIDLTLNDAYLWDVRARYNVHIVDTVVEAVDSIDKLNR